MDETPFGVSYDSIHNEFREDFLRLIHMAEELEVIEERVAFSQSRRGLCREETEEKMSDTIRYILVSFGVISLFFVGVFVASFLAWKIGKWGDGE